MGGSHVLRYPAVYSISKSLVEINKSVIIDVVGENFDINSRVELIVESGDPATNVSLIVLTPQTAQIVFDTPAVESLYSINIYESEAHTSLSWPGGIGQDAITVVTSLWWDLRTGGDVLTFGNGAGNDVRYRSGMSHQRVADGLYFTGYTPWSSWVKCEMAAFTRSSQKDVAIIFKGDTNYQMRGIASDATNETDTAQYSQFEVSMYQSGSSTWGLYGNDGTIGSTGSCSQSGPTIFDNAVYRLEFHDAGSAGSIVRMYQLPSEDISDWDDTSSLVWDITVCGSLDPDEENLFPGVIPQNGGNARLMGVSK